MAVTYVYLARYGIHCIKFCKGNHISASVSSFNFFKVRSATSVFQIANVTKQLQWNRDITDMRYS